MLNIIDNLNTLDLPLSSILVNFDVINMFPNYLGLSSVKKYLHLCSKNIPPTNCLLALELCLTCNNSSFLNKGALEYHLSTITWERFRDDIFVLWSHGREFLVLFLDYINTLAPTQKIKFTMEVAEPGNYLEFSDLTLKWENGKTRVDFHSKPTNSF